MGIWWLGGADVYDYSARDRIRRGKARIFGWYVSSTGAVGVRDQKRVMSVGVSVC